MRFVAFALLASAAFEWPAWWLDRAGTAALGLAFLALAVGGARGRVAPLQVPPMRVKLPDRALLEQAQAAEHLARALEEDEEAERNGDGETSRLRYTAEGWRRGAGSSS
jgi:hypothetical protein